MTVGNLGRDDGMQPEIGGYFKIKLPDGWTEDEIYDFELADVEAMLKEGNPFQKIDYSKILSSPVSEL